MICNKTKHCIRMNYWAFFSILKELFCSSVLSTIRRGCPGICGRAIRSSLSDVSGVFVSTEGTSRTCRTSPTTSRWSGLNEAVRPNRWLVLIRSAPMESVRTVGMASSATAMERRTRDFCVITVCTSDQTS